MVITREGTHKSNKRSPEDTYLLDDTLCQAIRSRCYFPVASPSTIENAARSLDDIEYKKGQLSHDQYMILDEGWVLAITKTCHINVSVGLK